MLVRTRRRGALLIAFLFLVSNAFGQEPPTSVEDPAKRAQSGMKFVSVPVDARAAALGNSVTALDMGSASMFYNPAGMALMQSTGEVSLAMAQWIANIDYNQASLAFRPSDGMYGVFGATIRSIDYGQFEGTIRANNNQGYEETHAFSPSALAAGLGYARALSSRFTVGGNVRYVRQDLGESIMRATDAERETQQNVLQTAAFDFGVIYRTGFRSLNFAMSARNFSPAVEFEEEAFELPLILTMGLSMDVMDLADTFTDSHSFLLSLDAAHPRDFAETISLGGEYVFMDIIALRAGYLWPTDEQGVNLGGGLQYSVGGLSFGADYAYTQFGAFGDVNRFAVRVGL